MRPPPKQTPAEEMGYNIHVHKLISPTHYNLDRQDVLRNNYVTMLRDGVNSDITLRSKRGSVRAHRSVLAEASPVFEAMFKHDMQERRSSSVRLPDMTIGGLRIFLTLLYVTSGSHAPAIDNLANLFEDAILTHFDELADACMKYQVTRVMNVLQLKLRRKLTPANCWTYIHKFLADSETVTSKISYKSCISFAVKHVVQLIDSDNFLEEMSKNPKIVHEILMHVFKL
ncbi:BTB/POZ domain-containing protein At1g55760 isoform X1 [Physcomitrium patens]|uniref:BTB domain-containing protein n=2 Tax=Physcomitrium patens TaxID=3218 RepID=A0A2K1IU58_PHYPA|nr:BTB/POZ domain-containing protein At1g55760-like [Physcomitrium patens]PNR32810.1 hypothetical protein PHYPA_024752 [Physcomitrium patens]|eukprot:XP_024356856.1 BTB/POZ domain-containing protein At1g55760-like [Physcomitrella patens]